MKWLLLLTVSLCHSSCIAAEPLLTPGLYFNSSEVKNAEGLSTYVYAMLFIGRHSSPRLTIVVTPYRPEADIAAFKRREISSLSSRLRKIENGQNKLEFLGEISVFGSWREILVTVTPRKEYLLLNTALRQTDRQAEPDSRLGKMKLPYFIPLEPSGTSPARCQIHAGTNITSESPSDALSLSIIFSKDNNYKNTGISATLNYFRNGTRVINKFSEGGKILKECDASSLTSVFLMSEPIPATGQVISMFDAKKKKFFSFGLLEDSVDDFPDSQTEPAGWSFPFWQTGDADSFENLPGKNDDLESYLVFPAKRSKHWRMPVKPLKKPAPKSDFYRWLPKLFLVGCTVFSLTLFCKKGF